MKIECRHGYFIFRERESGDIARFNNYFGYALEPHDDFYTFPFLVDAPEYSIKTKSYLGVAATEQFAGYPWEVMEANGLIYDFTKDLLKSITSVTAVAPLEQSGFIYVSSGLILPGSFLNGVGLPKRIKDYDAVFNFGSLRFKYSKVVSE